MGFRASAVLALLALFTSSYAVCIIPEDASQEKVLKAAKTVFVATITEASLEKSRTELRDGQWYAVRYKFEVAIPIKGNPADIPFLTTAGLYDAPELRKFHRFGEQSRFVPGDSILVIANSAGEAPISWSCTDSLPWSVETYKLLKKANMLPPSTGSKASPLR